MQQAARRDSFERHAWDPAQGGTMIGRNLANLLKRTDVRARVNEIKSLAAQSSAELRSTGSAC